MPETPFSNNNLTGNSIRVYENKSTFAFVHPEFKMTTKVAAGFIIFRRFASEIQYLLLHASHEKDLWTPPKGHVDPGENEMETALRETQEEAGFTSSDLNVYKDYSHTLHYMAFGKPKRTVYWLAELTNPETPVRLSDEHIDYSWVNIEDALKKLYRFNDMQSVMKDTDKYIKEKIVGKL